MKQDEFGDAILNRRSYLRALGTSGIIVLTTGFAGCSENMDSTNGSASGMGPLVEMTDDLTFEPKRVEIPTGETVVWRNVGSVGHTVTAYKGQIPADTAYFASGGFESEQAARDGYSNGKGNIAGGEEYTHLFEIPGEYEYFCIPHEQARMKGTVHVTDTTESTNENKDVAAAELPMFDQLEEESR